MEKKVEKPGKARTDAATVPQVQPQSPQEPRRKVSKAWEAAQRLKGSVIINDPTLYWR